LREEAGAQPILLRSGLRPDGGERGVPILQALQHLAGETWGSGERGRWIQAGQGPSPYTGHMEPGRVGPGPHTGQGRGVKGSSVSK